MAHENERGRERLAKKDQVREVTREEAELENQNEELEERAEHEAAQEDIHRRQEKARIQK
jgi:hypothetical protein